MILGFGDGEDAGRLDGWTLDLAGRLEPARLAFELGSGDPALQAAEGCFGAGSPFIPKGTGADEYLDGT